MAFKVTFQFWWVILRRAKRWEHEGSVVFRFTCGWTVTDPNNIGALLVSVLICHLGTCHVCKVSFTIPSRQRFKIRARLWWGGINWEFGVSRYKLLHIKQTTRSYCTAQGAIFRILQYTIMGKNTKKNMCIYVYCEILSSSSIFLSKNYLQYPC